MTKVVSKRVGLLAEKKKTSCVLHMLLDSSLHRLLCVADILLARKSAGSLVHDDFASAVAAVDALVLLPAITR